MATDKKIEIWVLNPNSDCHVTDLLESHLLPTCPPDVKYTFLTGPSSPGSGSAEEQTIAPSSIKDDETAAQSTTACLWLLQRRLRESAAESAAQGEKAQLPSGILVACFSSHPLVPLLNSIYPTISTMHILDTAVSHSLALCSILDGSSHTTPSLSSSSSSCPEKRLTKFGILTTVQPMVSDIDHGVYSYLGSSSTTTSSSSSSTRRYAGTLASGLGVSDLHSAMDTSLPTEQRDKLVGAIQQTARSLVRELDASVIILGCAGMSGMEGLILSALELQEAEKVRIVDGVKAGVQLLAGLARYDRAAAAKAA